MIDQSFEHAVRLVDGRTALLRCVRPSDAGLLRAGFERLSPASRYARFHTIVKELRDELVHDLTHVDGTRHFALGAVERTPEGERGLGVARFVRVPDHPERAELAITVVDDAQRLGLASRLFEVLQRAAQERGVRTFVADVLAENAKARALMRSLGAEPIARDHGVVLYRIDLPTPARVPQAA
jgi:RimJ/RimL family protein N-acetyltransferase